MEIRTEASVAAQTPEGFREVRIGSLWRSRWQQTVLMTPGHSVVNVYDWVTVHPDELVLVTAWEPMTPSSGCSTAVLFEVPGKGKCYLPFTQLVVSFDLMQNPDGHYTIDPGGPDGSESSDVQGVQQAAG